MATKAAKKDDVKSLRERLTAKKLTADDIRRIDAILAREEGGEQSLAGKRIIARLPHGMDVVK